jgi:glycerol-3-phosphate dehydrogenase
MSQKSISIIWNWVYGRALAHLFRKRHIVQMFGRTIREAWDQLISDFGMLGSDADYVIISITTSGLSEVYPMIVPALRQWTHVILAMKWLTLDELLPIDECLRHTPDISLSILSGPGFAHEILSDTPVHLIFASESITEVEQEDFLIDGLTLDFSHDVLGVSWCGVLKNVYAIGAGMASTESGWDRSQYTTRVVHEMAELLTVLGWVWETAMSPAWRWDVWICTTPDSRNFRYGESLSMPIGTTVEGYSAARILQKNYRDIITSERFPIIASIISRLQ